MFPERPDSIDVECKPLDAFLRGAGIEKIDFIKFDLEGMEYKVLRKFFERADTALMPRFIQVEQLPHTQWIKLAGGNVLDLVRDAGYSRCISESRNFIFSRE